MRLGALGLLADRPAPLEFIDLPVPEPVHGQVRVRVSACGVCHTELDEIEGRAPPPRLPVIPGHQVVGRVDRVAPGVRGLAVGDRVGVGWIWRSSGGADENLSPAFTATGRDVDGGYAEFMVVDARYAHPIPGVFEDVEAAPLLCAGSVGHRALKLTGLTNGQRLGLTGFGASAHLVLGLAKYRFPDSEVAVFARSAADRAFAASLGADWCGDTEDEPPAPLHAIIDTTPAWRPVLAALRALAPGGRLVINAIRKEPGDRDLLSGLRYADHLWMEKTLKTVANVTGADIREFLDLAAAIPLKPAVRTYPLAAANAALHDLRLGRYRGALVLKI